MNYCHDENLIPVHLVHQAIAIYETLPDFLIAKLGNYPANPWKLCNITRHSYDLRHYSPSIEC